MLRLVTLGTDGLSNFVETPDGTRYSLGSVSPLQVAKKFLPDKGTRIRAVRGFNAEGSVVVSLDVDALLDFLRQPRRRLAANPFIDPEKRGTRMNIVAVEKWLARAERYAAQAEDQGKDEDQAEKLAAALAVPDFTVLAQDQEQDEPEQDAKTAADDSAGEDEAEQEAQEKQASFGTFSRTAAEAEGILARVAAADEKIDELVQAGKKFNAAQARADLHGIVASMGQLLRQVDMGTPWVHAEVTKLASEADRIAELFGV